MRDDATSNIVKKNIIKGFSNWFLSLYLDSCTPRPPPPPPRRSSAFAAAPLAWFYKTKLYRHEKLHPLKIAGEVMSDIINEPRLDLVLLALFFTALEGPVSHADDYQQDGYQASEYYASCYARLTRAVLLHACVTRLLMISARSSVLKARKETIGSHNYHDHSSSEHCVRSKFPMLHND